MKWQYIHLYNLFYIQSYIEYTYQSLIVVKINMMLETNTIENATIHCVQAMSSLFVLAFCWIAVLITKKKIFLRDKSYLIQYISMFSGIHCNWVARSANYTTKQTSSIQSVTCLINTVYTALITTVLSIWVNTFCINIFYILSFFKYLLAKHIV